MPDSERAVPSKSGLQRNLLRISATQRFGPLTPSGVTTVCGRSISPVQKISLVNLASILVNHSVAVIGRYERLHSPLHHSNPVVRQTVGSPVVVERNDLFFKDSVK